MGLKISGATAAGSFLTTHELPVNEGGASKKVTGAQILAKTAQGSLGYIEVTANQGTITTQVDLTSLTLTFTPATGRRQRVTGYCSGVISSVGGDTAAMLIMEGATQLGAMQTGALLTGYGQGVRAEAILTLTNAAHTIKLQAVRVAGTGNVTFAASTTNRMSLLIEDIGT